MTERQQELNHPRAVSRIPIGRASRSGGSHALALASLCLLLYGLLCVGFVLSVCANRASWALPEPDGCFCLWCALLLLLLPLLALMATGQVIVSSRLDGTLELLFSHPLDRRRLLLAIALVRYLSLLLPLAVLLSLCCLLLNLLLHQPIPWGFLLRSLLVSASLLFAFTGLGLLISTTVRTQTRAMITCWQCFCLRCSCSTFGIIGILRLPAASVFLSCRRGIQSSGTTCASVSVEPELSTLGPVGFYLANRLGSNLLLAVGIGWPARCLAG